ncbi:MAG: HAMP domain-containing histidine kinase [Sphingobacteriales bacterium]|nr:HAMP domain-containing histidine kinase [Sphingobacteriales bacterium]
MKKGLFGWMVAGMSLALAGIILFQANWIRNEYGIRSDEYDRQVRLALQQAIEDIQSRESMRLVLNDVFNAADSSAGSVLFPDSLVVQISDWISGGGSLSDKSGSARDELVRKRLDQIIRAYRGGASGSIDIADAEIGSAGGSQGLALRIEKELNGKEVINLELEAGLTGDSLLNSVDARVRSRMKRFRNMVQKLSLHVVDPAITATQRISPAAMDSILSLRFLAAGIQKPTAFYIRDGISNGITYSSPGADTGEAHLSPFHAVLFPDDVLGRKDELIISVTRIQSLVLREMWSVLVLSLVFMAVIVSGFTYTVWLVFRQKKLAEMKNDFINNMTHEFKTPIATIAIATAAMRNSKIQSDVEKLGYYNGVIEEENQRMLRQVDKVLQMARIEKGELQLERKKVNLVSVLQESVNAFKLKIHEAEGVLEFKCDAPAHQLNADAFHLGNAFANLIDNAIKYSPEKPRVRILVNGDVHSVLISILDQGMGMSAEVKKRIFDTFYRAQVGDLHSVKGFGLGLSYVKAIIEAHGGTIDVESEPGKGSCFNVSLPLNQLNHVS